jgi:hypothetical protein
MSPAIAAATASPTGSEGTHSTVELTTRDMGCRIGVTVYAGARDPGVV